MSTKAAKADPDDIREWRMASTRNNQRLEDLARVVNPVVRGWMNYYGRFYRSKCVQVLRHLNEALAAWVRRKYTRFRRRERASMHWLGRIARRDPKLFALWQLGVVPRLDCRSRMRREFHVRFCEGGGVKFPRYSTRRHVPHGGGVREGRKRVRAVPARPGLEPHPDKDETRRPFGGATGFDFLGCHLRKGMSGRIWER